MPIKDAAARAEYMKKYQAEYRQGKRRTDPAKVTQRTQTSRAAAEKKRKALWYLRNKEWCADRLRERRRSAAAQSSAQLLEIVSNPPADSKTAGEKPRRAAPKSKAGQSQKNTPTKQRAA